MATPSTAATAGIATAAYSIGAIISANLVWHYGLQTPPVLVPPTIADGWTVLIGAGLQACGHAAHWVANRNKATGAHVVLTPVSK